MSITKKVKKIMKNGIEYLFDFVDLTSNQSVDGIKTFLKSPVVPSKTSDATDTGTSIATEAQVYKKANSSDVLTKTNTASFTPSGDYNPATKKYVDDKYADLMALGKFLSLWNCATGQPISFPLDTPYIYHTGDYFMVEILATGGNDNLMPNGSSYTGSASQTPDTTNEVKKGDFYIYDGTVWLYASNHGKDVSFSNIAGSPSDNTALSNALAAKQDSLTLPATPTQGNLVTWGADNETLVDGGVVPTGVPSGGTNGQILMMVNGTPTWVTPVDKGFIMDAGGPTTIKYIWAGSDTDYGNLGTYNNNTRYDTY